jgi:hypothetical protein
MKKYLVLFVIAAFVLVLYLRNREAAVKTDLLPAPVQETGLPPGVALPADAGKIQPVTPEQLAASQAQQPQPIAMPPAPNMLVFSPADACTKETKVKDVLANYNKTWGYMAKDKLKSYAVLQSVGEQGIKELSALVGKYQACVSLARDKDLCGSLPKVDGKVDSEMNRSCLETFYPVGFSGYTMGKAGYLYCAGYFKNNLKGASEFTSEANFCAMAREGLPSLSDKFCGSVPAGMRATCLGSFPKDPSGCKNEVCSLVWSVRVAVENNAPGMLGPDLGPLAAVLLDKREESCQQLGDMAVQQYCSVKSRIEAKVQELEISKNQDQLNKQLRTGRENKSED